MDRNELAVKQPQARRDAGRPVTVGRLHAADAQINAAMEFPPPRDRHLRSGLCCRECILEQGQVIVEECDK